MATVGYYLDTRRARKDGKCPLKLNIRHDGQIIISTEYAVDPSVWTGFEYDKSELGYKAKNIAIRSLLNKVESLLLRMENDGSLKSTTDKRLKDLIKAEIDNKPIKENKFIDYIDMFISTKHNEGTLSVYRTTRSKVLAFDPACTFDTIDRRWLTRFERSMLDSGMKVNAVAVNLRNIRAVFNYAIDEEETTLYPFRKFKIAKEQTRKRSLTVEQLRTLRDYPCEDYQTKYVDIFFLMFYLIGINAVDLFLCKDLVNGRLEYKRAKTGKLYSIKVEPEAMEIIERYKGDDLLLNVLDNYASKNYKYFLHWMNEGLQNIGELERKGLGGKKDRKPLFPDLTSYWTRHTWATIAAGLDIPKETISAALGHEIGSSVTSIYIDFDQRKVDDANRKVIDYVFGTAVE